MRVAGVAFPQFRVAGMRQDLVDAAARITSPQATASPARRPWLLATALQDGLADNPSVIRRPTIEVRPPSRKGPRTRGNGG